MLNSNDLINKVKIYNKFLNPERLDKAFNFAIRAHKNQKRASGDPYSVHPIEVANIADSYAVEKDGEIILINSHIATFKQASYSNHNPIDERKLLLNKKEISKLIGKMQRDGFTLVPTKMYFKKGKAKIEIAVAKGKKQFDKRATKKNRDWNREKARHIRKSS